MDLPERKRFEVLHKLEGLDAEFQRWLDASEVGGDFQKHHTQIRAVIHRLGGFRDRIKSRLGNECGLSDAREMSQMLLSLYRMWEFFRAKFAQRFETSFARFLKIADEFAWLCYKPIYESACCAGTHSFREPPFIFLNGGVSPFILTRNSSFQAEAVPHELIQDMTLREAMKRLPFPVVGVPWHQLAQLPEVLAVAHEIGHSVEVDFSLEPTLDSLVELGLTKTNGEPRADYWKSWRSEVFADLCGCLGGGPAFASALSDFLLADSDEIISQPPTKDSYPSPNIRVRINACILETMGFKTEAKALLDSWDSLFPLPSDQQPFLTDAREIMTLLISSPIFQLGNRSLSSVLCFEPAQHAKAKEQADLASNGSPLNDYKDMRLTLAATRLAYETNPVAFFQPPFAADPPPPTPAARLEAKLTSLLANDLRAGEDKREGDEQAQADVRNCEAGILDFENLLRMQGIMTAAIS